MQYAVAPQHCLCCGTEITFVPFKDPVCDDCCKPVSLVAESEGRLTFVSHELPTPREQAHIIHRLAPITCSKEA